jgi:hypothetical protein
MGLSLTHSAPLNPLLCSAPEQTTEYRCQCEQAKQKILLCGLLSEIEFWLVFIVVTVVTAVVTAVVTIGFCVVTVVTGEMGMFNKVYSSGRYGHYTKTNGHYSGHYSGHYGRYKEHSRLQGHSQQHTHPPIFISTKDDPLQHPAKLNNTFRIAWAAHPFPQKQSCKREQPQGNF